MQFELDRLRLLFEACRPLVFEPWKAANAFRGALGLVLPPSLFSPVRPVGAGPSGLANPPRPFVIRAAHLNGRSLEPGELFFVDLHVFNSDSGAFERAFRSADPLHGGARFIHAEEREHVRVSLHAALGPVKQVSVRFVSPTELKNGGTVAPEPDFPVLFSRAVSRLRALSPKPLDVDFVALSRQASEISLVSQALILEKGQRRSTRTGQVHPMGGFRGEATYGGELRQLVPYLRAAEWTGVGRQTVWGKGEIQVRT